MSVEVSLNTPLADALSNVVQPKLTEIGWNTGGLDDSALGEYIILMLVNGKTQDQIAAELSNDLLSLGPDDTGATDFAKWLFEQVHLLNAQTNGTTAPQTQQASQGQGSATHHIGEDQLAGGNGETGASITPDADMGEAMDDVQDGAIPTGPKSMRSAFRPGNKRLIGQLSKAMDRSGDAVLHRVRPQQGTERINTHNRQPPKGPRNDQSRNQRLPPNLRPSGAPNGGMPNGGMATPLMNASPQQQMALFAMLEEQARMMSQIFSPQQQSSLPQPAINPNFRPGGQGQNQQSGRSLFDRIERPNQRQNGSFSKRQHNNKANLQTPDHHLASTGVEGAQDPANGDVTSSMEVESSQKSQFEQSSDTICKFNLKCSKTDCPFGENCIRAGCKFKHVSITCKFNPCLNPECSYKHTENQKGGNFRDKVWKADRDQEREHVSERKFVDDNMAEELRTYATAIPENGFNSGVDDVAVLGGGITGLASAYYLAERLPHAQITLFEGSPRLGGWLRSKQVDVGSGRVVFEQGPRNLRPTRPNGWVTLDLVKSLGLEDQVLMTSKESVAAQNRFIYYPDHLVRMPGPGSSLLPTVVRMLQEPVFKGLFRAAMFETFRPVLTDLQDESVGSFISRRFGPALANNIVSALLHGIYAGDVYQLSVRSIFPYLFHAEREIRTSVGAAYALGFGLRWPQDAPLEAEWARARPISQRTQAIRDSSVFTFKKGLGQLADQLETKLRQLPNVSIRLETVVDQLQLKRPSDSENIGLRARSGSAQPTKESFSHVISTISGKALYGAARPAPSMYVLSQTPAVTVMVVNLYFSNPSVLPVRGFGYLLPRSLPFEQNPERALGVVFDSDASIGQDNIPGTKVTVMLGGHWWDGWQAYPDEDMGANMAKSVLKRHLGISEIPRAIHVGLQKNCIPQYTVGHHRRMSLGHEALQKFQGRLRVAGSSYTGVGLNDCVRSARNVVASLVEGRHQDTGLESFARGNGPILSR
ncbi:MAG: hypothetical protein Q9173_000961 [Seirophora scorigena]